MGLLDFAKYLFNDIPPDYQGPETGYYVVPDGSRFTFSSGRGDFHLLPLAGGCFAACWKDFIHVRDTTGHPLWLAEGTGRTVAASPDGRQLLAFGAATEVLLRFDSQSGRVLDSFELPPLPTAADTSPGWPVQLGYLPDGYLLVLLGKGVGVLAPDGSHWRAYHTGFLPADEVGPPSLCGMVWQPARPDEVLVADFDGRLAVLHLGTGQVLRQSAYAYCQLLPGPLGQQPLLLAHNHTLVCLDPATLAERYRHDFVGLDGVRTVGEASHQRSSTRWQKRAVLSPNGRRLLAADQSGLVWLFDARSGRQLRIFRRELIDHAYDLMWLTDEQFLALTNWGHVVKQDITQLTSVFNVTDFTPADAARHAPERYAGATSRPASTGTEVLAALDTLASTPDAATYAAAWETIHYAPDRFDWPAYITPAHLDGAMRSYAWMLPSSGFTGLALFAELRQALLAVQYHLPTAPVAPVLALHDRVFGPEVTFETPDPAAGGQEIALQLNQAYQQLKCTLLEAEAEDVETGAPFVLTAPYRQYERLCDEAAVFLLLLASWYSSEALAVLGWAFPALAGYYAERLATFPAPVQRRLLQPVRYNATPSARGLLRELAAASPHPDIRAFARQALAETADR